MEEEKDEDGGKTVQSQVRQITMERRKARSVSSVMSQGTSRISVPKRKGKKNKSQTWRIANLKTDMGM